MKKSNRFALLVLLAGLALAAVQYQGVPVAVVPVAVPEGTRWQTTRPDGILDLWSSRPFVLKTDFGGYVWTTDDGVLLGSIAGGAAPTDMRKTLRRVK